MVSRLQGHSKKKSILYSRPITATVECGEKMGFNSVFNVFSGGLDFRGLVHFHGQT